MPLLAGSPMLMRRRSFSGLARARSTVAALLDIVRAASPVGVRRRPMGSGAKGERAQPQRRACCDRLLRSAFSPRRLSEFCPWLFELPEGATPPPA